MRRHQRSGRRWKLLGFFHASSSAMDGRSSATGPGWTTLDGPGCMGWCEGRRFRLLSARNVVRSSRIFFVFRCGLVSPYERSADIIWLPSEGGLLRVFALLSETNNKSAPCYLTVASCQSELRKASSEPDPTGWGMQSRLT